MICAILRQARRNSDYVVWKIFHAQFYMVKNGALMPAGNCMAESAFFEYQRCSIHLLGKQTLIV